MKRNLLKVLVATALCSVLSTAAMAKNGQINYPGIQYVTEGAKYKTTYHIVVPDTTNDDDHLSTNMMLDDGTDAVRRSQEREGVVYSKEVFEAKRARVALYLNNSLES